MNYVAAHGAPAGVRLPAEDFGRLLRDGPPPRTTAEERLHRKQALAATFRAGTRRSS